MTAAGKQLLPFYLLMLISCRCSNTKTVEPTPPPLLPPLVSVGLLPTVVINVTLKDQSHTERIEVTNPINLSLECIWAGNQNKPLNITAYWAKEGREIQDSRQVVLENDQYKLDGLFSIAGEEHLGNYSCVFGNEAKVNFTVAAPQMAEMQDKPIIGYVRDSVVLVCKMEKVKSPPITWNWYKENGTEKEQIAAAAEPHRYEIHNDERKTKLKVKGLTEADSGMYYCGAVYTVGTSMGHMKLKVITFMEPLKPFIGIMAEVIFLVAAILLCELSQSKKNNVEEDATNADQNNIVQHGDEDGEEKTSTRQRKV